jgi:hypothetical protein
VQAVWFALALNVPFAHAVHARLTVAVPVTLTNVPAAQVVHGTQAVAEF